MAEMPEPGRRARNARGRRQDGSRAELAGETNRRAQAPERARGAETPEHAGQAAVASSGRAAAGEAAKWYAAAHRGRARRQNTFPSPCSDKRGP
jgi:hypothetical protein